MVARGWSRAEVFALVQLNRSAAQSSVNPPQTAAGPSDEAAVAPEAAAPAPATTRDLVGDNVHVPLRRLRQDVLVDRLGAQALPPAPHRVAPLARPAPRHARVLHADRRAHVNGRRALPVRAASGERGSRERGFSTASALRRLTDGEPSWR